jgi:hypothetical protein
MGIRKVRNQEALDLLNAHTEERNSRVLEAVREGRAALRRTIRR